MLAHAGANLLSDYYDYKARVDREGTFGSSGLLVGKVMNPSQILRGAWIALIVAGAIGLYFILATPKRIFLLWVILVGGIFGVFYTAGPVEFKYRALGDIAVFVSFGPAMVLGAYYVQAHHFSWGPVLYGIPIALLVDAILHSNNLGDIKNDSMVNIKTVPILIGEKWSKIMYYGLVLGAYILTVVLIAVGMLSIFSLLAFASLERIRAYCLPATSLSTTSGSARVEVSPSSSIAPWAIFLRILRMIFPLRVFGRASAK